MVYHFYVNNQYYMILQAYITHEVKIGISVVCIYAWDNHIDCPCLHSYLLIFTCLCSFFINELSDVWLTCSIPIPLFKLKIFTII